MKNFRLIGFIEIIVGAIFLLAAGVNAATSYGVRIQTPWFADQYAQYALELAIPGIVLLIIGLFILRASKATPTPA